MNRLFGSNKPAVPKATLSQAITATDARSDTIQVKIKGLESDLYKIKTQMKGLSEGAGKRSLKERAMRILKQKKLYEGQLDTIQAQVFTMEQTSMTTENLKNTLVTMDAMKAASKEMKKVYKNVNLDKIERMKDEMEDLMQDAEDIQEIMGRSYNTPEIDEDDLEAELDALGDEDLFEDEEPNFEPITNAPSIPGAFVTEEEKPVLI